MNNLIKSSIAASTLLMSSMASAALITTWDYEVVNEWDAGASVFSAGNGTTVSNASELSWGATGGSFDGGANNRSALVISGSPSTGQLDTNDLINLAESATITHYNNSISNTFSFLEQATLMSTLTLTPFAPVPGPALPSFSQDFVIDFDETPNSAPCGDPASVSVCDDIFSVALGDLSQSFMFDGYIYTVTISAVGLGPLTNEQCAIVGKAPGCIGFTTQEGLTTPANFEFSITARQVPEPATLGVLSLGLLLLGARRFKK
ncbi:THxN family PEP-CTERM protein [Bowmanella dokdonensis]|uniref:THxN family PEP-CTERM protein n=1 Tax=Bowmanella dokdonensis TaxID=751969 RepID=A0A939IQU3_9ALTE|nr:THxN family PEP-CTERM protein [Bowmanella dokdonensis]MBN7827295.1 THxN family PEP-CTERM protein [Bowmanella dokdonensis]